MIERLLAADDALERGELELAERLFAQVAEADARNAIAAVGLARLAARRGDTPGARTWLVRALEIDPDEAAAKRLLLELDDKVPLGAATMAEAGVPPGAPPALTETGPRPVPSPAAAPTPAAAVRPSLLDRIRRWLALPGARR